MTSRKWGLEGGYTTLNVCLNLLGLRLAEKTNLNLTDEQLDQLDIITTFNISAR